MRNSGYNRRYSREDAGFDPLKQPGFAYRVEKRVDNVWLPVCPKKTIEEALRYVKDKPDWDARVVRISDGTVIT